MPSLPTVHGLVTVALLKAQFDEGKDHIGMFLPFLLDTLARMQVNNADAEMIKEAIEGRHGLAIPTPTLRILLKRARRYGVSREAGRYVITQSRLPDAGIEQRKAILREEHNALASAFVHFARSQGGTVLATDHALDLIFKFVAQNEVELLLADSPTVVARQLDTPGKRESHLTARFLLNVALRDERLTAYIERLLEGFVLQHALLLSDINALRARFNKLSVYFDSNVLFGALGLLGPSRRAIFLEVIDLLRKSGARLGVFGATMREMTRILDVYVARLRTNEGRRSLRPTALTRHILTSRMTPSDLRQYRALLDRKLRGIGVLPTTRPRRIRAYTLDEKDLSERLSVGDNISDGINEPRVVHDVDCVAAVLTLRRGRVTNDLPRSHAVFVTAGRQVLQTTRTWFRDQGLGGVPPIIHWNTISNLAWLKRPAHGTTSKVHQLTALCGAALRPDRATWQRFLDHLEKLEESNELDSDESVAILVSSLTDELLVELEDDGDLGASSLEEVVDRVRRTYASRAEEEIAAAKAQVRDSNEQVEAIERRQEAIANIVGNVGSWGTFGVLVIVSVSAVLLTSIAANVITLFSVIFGATLLGLRRALKDKLTSSVARALTGQTAEIRGTAPGRRYLVGQERDDEPSDA